MNNKEILKSTLLFNKLSTNQFFELISRIEEVKVYEGATFIREGDNADALYVIKEGFLQVFTYGNSDEEIILADLEKGSFFGEQSLLTDYPGIRNASVRALSDSTLLKIHHKTFRHIIQSDPSLKKELEQKGFQQLITKLKVRSTSYDIAHYLFNDENLYETKLFHPNEMIIEEGETAKGVYFLLSGMIDIYKKNEKGVDQLISSVTPNNLFGEAGIVFNLPRLATVKAQGDVRALFFSSKSFLQLCEKTPELKLIADTLYKVYQLPARGIVTQYSGQFLHMPAVIGKYKLPDGRMIISSRVIEKPIHSINVSTMHLRKSIVYKNRDVFRELQLVESQLVGLIVYGEWEAFEEICSRIFDKKTLTLEELIYFENNGELLRPQEVGKNGEEKFQYASINNKQELNFETEETSYSPFQSTNDCEDAQAMRILKIDELSDDVRAFRFVPIQNEASPPHFQDGQRIVVQCEINGQWIERSYSLTSEPQNSEFYEMAVKQEVNGSFSKWLFENDKTTRFIGDSNPAGHFILDVTKTLPLICMTSGIGITPAISFARALSEMKNPRPLFIYTFVESSHLLYNEELEALSKKQPLIHYLSQYTAMSSEDVIKIARKNPDADFFICGPKSFELMIKSSLVSVGIKPSQIMVEQLLGS